MANEIDDEFVEYCRGLLDRQLEAVLAKEFNAYQHRDYPSATVAAAERGWRVRNGERQ